MVICAGTSIRTLSPPNGSPNLDGRNIDPGAYSMRVKTSFFLLFALASLLVFSLSLSAQVRNTGRATTRQTETLLTRIETKIDILKDEVDRIAERNTSSANNVEPLPDYLAALQQELTQLQETFEARNPINNDVNNTLISATRIDQFMLRNRVSPAANAQWRSLKRDFTTLATYNRLSWNWNQRVPAWTGTTAGVTPVNPVDDRNSGVDLRPATYTVMDSQVRTVLSRVDLKSGIFRTQLQSALRTDTSVDISNEAAMEFVSRFETAENRLRQQFDSRRATVGDVTDVLMAATYLDQFMNRNRLTPSAQAQWRNLRGDLNTLATYFQQSWNWNQSLGRDTVAGNVNLRNFDQRITGTYRLNTSLSEDPSAAVNRVLGSSNAANRDNVSRGLENRLSSPEMIAIQMNNKNVDMASSILPRVSFQADGVARSESNPRGRTITTTATVDADGLIINYQGERASDFYLTMLPTADGKLRVTRRIFLDNSNQDITVTSVYDKVDQIARWDNVSYSLPGDTNASTVVENSFVIPSGTRLSASLRTAIVSSNAAERFVMEVTSPAQFRGATISGRVLNEDPSTRVAGMSRVLLAFDTVTLPRENKTYRFASNVLAVTSDTGELVQVTNQAATNAAAQQRGVGGILGALIGAVAGVPIQGNTSTAGAVLAIRSDVFRLEPGTQIALQALVLQQ